MLDNCPFRTLQHKDLTIEGYSRAAVQSYWRIPELKLGFDLGAQPWDFMGTPAWFISHTHLDHIAALPVYVARRRMMKMEPPIDLPAGARDRAGASTSSRLVSGSIAAGCRANSCAVRPGDEIELSRELVVTAVATRHTVPSLGYVVWERRKKLKAEYRGSDRRPDSRHAAVGRRRSPRSGAIPLVAYTGDTSPEGLDAEPGDVRGEDADHRNDVRRARATARKRSTSTATCTWTTSSSGATGSRTN